MKQECRRGEGESERGNESGREKEGKLKEY